MKRLVIAHMTYKEQPCLVMAQEEGGRLCSLHLERPGTDRLLGSIHVGKVQRVLPNIKGAFVEIEGRLPCYLPCNKKLDPIFTSVKKSQELKAGDELLVQVTQEALKLKAPCVSCNLSFSGSYLVLTTENQKIGVSEKLPASLREELKEFIKKELPKERSYGVIVRTNAGEAHREQIRKELVSLQEELAQTLKKGSYSPCYTKIKKGESPILQELKRVYWDELEKIVTDDREIYETISAYVKKFPAESTCQVQLYQDTLLPLYKLYRLEHGLEESLQEKVWLKSGGFLIIQQTEAFVAVDVNSGKNMSRKQAEEVYPKINLEAAKEIARQLRLRNLYGMILIDFINMQQYEDRSELVRAMRNFVKDDRVKTTVVDVTALGIMELTRKKEEKSLKEQVMDLYRDRSEGGRG
ncbi:MAG: ribonuclease E/G [Clostridiales bacterium]|nr:ribonuclease E/G [Clostridiales bacterium]